MSIKSRDSAAWAFTLVELLVVIVVIGILATLVLTATVKVRQAGDSAKCVANMRQIGVAMIQYSSENMGYFPPHYGRPFFDPEKPDVFIGWAGHLAPYLGATNYNGPVSSIFYCPADPDSKKRPLNATYVYNTPDPRWPISYGYNYQDFTSQKNWRDLEFETTAANVRRMQRPSSIILAADSTPLSEGGSAPDLIYWQNPASELSANKKRHHGNGFNAVFVDGHVKGMNYPEAGNNPEYWRPR